MSDNRVLIDLFDRGEFHEIMIMFHHSLIHDHPILANSVAQFIFMWTDDPEDLGDPEANIIVHLTEQLINPVVRYRSTNGLPKLRVTLLAKVTYTHGLLT